MGVWAKSWALIGRAPCWQWRSSGVGLKKAERRGGGLGGVGWGGEKGERGWGGVRWGGIVTRELKVLLRSSLSPSNLHWS